MRPYLTMQSSDNIFKTLKSTFTANRRMRFWEENNWTPLSQIILDSYARWIGEELIDRRGKACEQAERLFYAPFVVVAHGVEENPILSYGNKVALELWKISVPVLLKTPSRETAEPVHREERTRLLERTRRNGYVDDYRGIRVSTTGKRFLVDPATVWNLVDEQGMHVGQAATFSNWKMLEETHS